MSGDDVLKALPPKISPLLQEGLVLANAYDDPPAQMTVALLGLVLVVAWGVRRWGHARGSV